MIPSNKATAASFAGVTTLFFTWGFITSIIDPLIPSVRAVFHLNFTESLLTQFAFFTAYGVVSLPGGLLVSRLGYARSILAALVIMTLGCLIICGGVLVQTYLLVLAGLFVIASGITILQVSANPLAAAMGEPKRVHFRLTLSQAFNSLGTVLGPFFGALIMLRGGIFAHGASAAETAANRAHSLGAIAQSFFLVAGLITLLTAFIAIFRRRFDGVETERPGPVLQGLSSGFASPWARFGALAVFLYVGAEVSIGSLMINFLHQKSILNLTLEAAGKTLVLYWLGAMIGRFFGAVILNRIAAFKALGVAAAGATLLCLVVSLSQGGLAAGAVLSVGLLNSIMFPTIFTLSMERSTAATSQTSGLLCMAIIGGAIIPIGVGFLADRFSLSLAYLAPAAAYAVITLFAQRAAGAPILNRPGADVATGHH